MILSLIPFVEKEKPFLVLYYRRFWKACHQSLTKEEELTVGHVLKYAAKIARG